MRRLSREQTTMFFDPSTAPAIEIDPGEHLIVETKDSLCGLAKREAPAGLVIDEVIDRLGGACPVTGPISIPGAEPGMVLSVHLHHVRAIPAEGEAWTGLIGGFGALSHDRYGIQEPLTPTTRLVPYRNGTSPSSLSLTGATLDPDAAVSRHHRCRTPLGETNVVLTVHRVPRRR